MRTLIDEFAEVLEHYRVNPYQTIPDVSKKLAHAVDKRDKLVVGDPDSDPDRASIDTPERFYGYKVAKTEIKDKLRDTLFGYPEGKERL